MLDNLLDNQNQSGTPPQRRLKKIKRLVKRPLPKPLSANPPIMNEISENINQNSEFSYNSNSEILPDDPNFLSDDTDFSLPATMDATPIEDSSNSFTSPRFVDENDIAPAQKTSFIQSLKESDAFTKKAVVVFSIVALFCGLVMGKIMFGTSTVVRNGLSGVVANPEVPKGRARCGVAEKTQGCVLYLMNPQRQDLNARDFYELASQLTGRQRFVIETGNMRYSNVKIAPGEIAQFNIPPLQ